MLIGGWAVQQFAPDRDSGARAASVAEREVAGGAALVPAAPLLPPDAPAPAANAGPAEGVQDELAQSQAAQDQIAQTYIARNQAERAEALLVAAAARRALDRGLSIGAIEPVLVSRFGASQPNAVNAILALSRRPVLLENLRSRLAALEPQLVGGGHGEEGFWAAAAREWNALVVVRGSEADKDSLLPAERFARALRLLDSERLDLAMTDVEALGGRRIAPRWLDDARRYNEARRALDVIETAALVESRVAPR